MWQWFYLFVAPPKKKKKQKQKKVRMGGCTSAECLRMLCCAVTRGRRGVDLYLEEITTYNLSLVCARVCCRQRHSSSLCARTCVCVNAVCACVCACVRVCVFSAVSKSSACSSC